MSDEIVFGPGEAEAWDAYVASWPGGPVGGPERVAAECAAFADALLLERRKRTAPQAQGEDGLPEGWVTPFAHDPDLHCHEPSRVDKNDDYWPSAVGQDWRGGWWARADNTNLDGSFSTRTSAIAAVEARLIIYKTRDARRIAAMSKRTEDTP